MDKIQEVSRGTMHTLTYSVQQAVRGSYFSAEPTKWLYTENKFSAKIYQIEPTRKAPEMI